MMIVNSVVNSEISRTITRPGALVEIGFDQPLRLSTRGARRWGGVLWQEMDYNRVTSTAAIVGSFEYTGDVVMEGSLRVNTVNREFAARCKTERIVSRSLRIWSLYGTNPFPADSDAVLEFDGFVRSAQLGAADYVTLAIVNEDLYAMYSPREFYNEVGGYSTVAAVDKLVTFGNQDFRFSAGA
jgi:hypothetical protein